MGRAIQRHDEESACVIPILLCAVHWDTAPFAKLQVVPTNAKQVTSWSDRDDAFFDITKHISQAVAELRSRRALVEIDEHEKDQQTHVAEESATASEQPLGSTSSSNQNQEDQQTDSPLSLVQHCSHISIVGVQILLIGLLMENIWHRGVMMAPFMFGILQRIKCSSHSKAIPFS
jgi:hypothetical protein